MLHSTWFALAVVVQEHVNPLTRQHVDVVRMVVSLVAIHVMHYFARLERAK